MGSSLENFIWQEKYRAKSVNELLLPERIKVTLSNFISQNEIPHYLFYGSAGIGKTTTAKVIIRELKASDLYVNASNETGIDTIRSKVLQFISNKSFDNALKIVILDECDALTVNAQQSLKVMMEEYSKNARFILITNNYNKIIEPLISRCTEINFNFDVKEENENLKKQYVERLISILKNEGVKVTQQGSGIIVKIIMDNFPDLRKIVGTIQSIVTQTNGDLANAKYESIDDKLDSLIDRIFDKDIKKLRKYMLDNFQNYEIDSLYSPLYKRLQSRLDNPLLTCQAITIISKYMFQGTFASDKELNVMAMFSELITEVVSNV